MNARIALLVSDVQAATSRRRALSAAVAACACAPRCARCDVAGSAATRDLLAALERLEAAQDVRR